MLSRDPGVSMVGPRVALVSANSIKKLLQVFPEESHSTLLLSGRFPEPGVISLDGGRQVNSITLLNGILTV
jgi:hypothetical protein